MLPRGPTFIVSSLTLWPIYPGGYYPPLLKVGWTLSFEMLFYLGMTVAMASRAAAPLALYALFLLGAMVTAAPLLHFVGNPMALEFLMGVVIASLPRRSAAGLLIPVGLALFAFTSPHVGDVDTIVEAKFAFRRVVEWGVPAAMIVWGALSIEPWFKRRLFDVPVAIGDASYSIYLFHPLIAYGLDFAWPVRLALAVGAGLTMHLLVERRIMAARRRWPALRLSVKQVKVA
jgi:peptidoglycan/LPS O-acetylase OafA/YrhL